MPNPRRRMTVNLVASGCALMLGIFLTALPGEGAVETFEGQNVPAGWTTGQTAGLLLTGETDGIARTGKKSLQWDWRHHRNHPDHRVNTLSWFHDNIVTYATDRPLAVAGSRQGLRLWVKKAADGNVMLRLEVLSGDRVVGRGWYYLSGRGWTALEYPYALRWAEAKGPITGLRIIAPANLVPDWPDCGPTTVWIDDVDCLAERTQYNGVWIESFEEPEGHCAWRADGGGQIGVVEQRFKAGTHSLLWSWARPGAALACSAPKCFERLGPRVNLAFWLYNEKSSSQRVRLELLSEGRVVGSCWYFLNFRGWRALAAPYSQVGWKPGQKLDGFRLLAPEGEVSGRFYLDFVNFQCPTGGGANYRPATPAADHQQPWIGRPELLTQPEKCLVSDRDISVNRPWLPPLVPASRIPARELEDMERLRTALLPKTMKFRLPAVGEVEKLEADLARWGLRRADGVLTGRTIGGNPGLNIPPDALSYRRDYVDVVNRAVLIYLAMRENSHPLAAKFRQRCIDLIEHLVDQGLAEGNNNDYFPVDSFFGIQPDRLLAMSRELDEAGLLADIVRAVNYQSGTDQTFAEEPSGDTDVILGFYGPQLRLLLYTPDPAERLQRLKALRRAINRFCSRLDHQPFGADGTAHHHGMHHWCYAGYEVPVVMRFVSTLHDTAFRLDPPAYEILKRFTLAMAWSANKYSMPTSLLARPGGSCSLNMATFAGPLAELGTADGRTPVEPELASLFLALTDKPESEQAVKYRHMGIKPYDFSGHRVLNGAATSIHRRNGWMVGIIGMNQHTGGLEIYGGSHNSYSSFARSGSVWVVSSGDPPTCEASGWRFEGWDSRHWPGTTSAVVAPQSLWFHLRGIRNRSLFAGGTDLDGDGLWGYEHRCLGIKFNKSAFCFGNRVTVVTTGIEREDKAVTPLVTTLYQNAFRAAPAEEPCWVDGSEIRAFPAQQLLAPGRPHWLIDNKGTGYFIHAGAAAVMLERHPQQWLYLWPDYLIDKDKDPMGLPEFRDGKFRDLPEERIRQYYKPTAGDFALAYFEHGTGPAATECVYTLIPRTDPKAMQQFCQAMAQADREPYRILQQDGRAHVLLDRATATTGYVLFQEGEVGAEGILTSNSRPCLVMVRRAGSGQLKLSVASTDWKNKKPMVLKFRGRWRVESADTRQPCQVTHEEDATRLEISYDFSQPTVAYMPIHAVLRPVVEK